MGGLRAAPERARPRLDRTGRVPAAVRAGAAGRPPGRPRSAPADLRRVAGDRGHGRCRSRARELVGYDRRLAVPGARGGIRCRDGARDARLGRDAADARWPRAAAERDDAALDRGPAGLGGRSGARRSAVRRLAVVRLPARGRGVRDRIGDRARDAPAAGCRGPRSRPGAGGGRPQRARRAALRLADADPARCDPARPARGAVRRRGRAAAAVRPLDPARRTDGARLPARGAGDRGAVRRRGHHPPPDRTSRGPDCC